MIFGLYLFFFDSLLPFDFINTNERKRNKKPQTADKRDRSKLKKGAILWPIIAPVIMIKMGNT